MEIKSNKELNVQGLLEPIRTRYSTRTFLPNRVEKEKVDLLLEAARWAPSCYNEQPWRFLVGERDGMGDYNAILSGLVEFNQMWAKSAPLLIVVLSAKNWSSSGKPNSWAGYDTGLAVGNLTLQAQHMGLYTHQMGGFVLETLRKNCEIPEEYEVYSVMAVGYIGNLSELPEMLREREVGERQRKNLAEIAFTSKWGNPYN